MMSAIEKVIVQYQPRTSIETKLVLREILQSIVLVGLSRGGFFEKASFYGGTALRILYGLNRFSEDLDFTLNKADETFSLQPYLKCVQETAASYGLELDISTKEKQIKTPIESAFAKLNTYQTFVKLRLDKSIAQRFHKDEVIKVKFEVDCNPALGFETENRWIDVPEYASISVLDESSLFAGKLHAILCRTYKNNVKGRDYYDFLFYTSKRIKPNLEYLRNKLIDTGKICKNDKFDIDILKKMLLDKFENVDFEQVKKDASRFVRESENVDFYCKELFMDMLKRL